MAISRPHSRTIHPASSWGYGVTRTCRRICSLGVNDIFCKRSSFLRKASAAESSDRIQPGTQLAPNSIRPIRRPGNRSSTPSMIIVPSVCMGAYGMARYDTDVKFLSPPLKSGTGGRPFSL